MTTYPRDCPLAVRRVVDVACTLVDDAGEVVGGAPALQAACGHTTARATRAAVAQAEAWRYLRRVGAVGHGPRRVFVVARKNIAGVCVEPGCDRIAYGQRRCRHCASTSRADRAWVSQAVEKAVAGKTPHEIAVELRQPLFPVEGNRGVLLALINEVPALVSASWIDALRAHHHGEGVLDIFARARLRRHMQKNRVAT